MSIQSRARVHRKHTTTEKKNKYNQMSGDLLVLKNGEVSLRQGLRTTED